MQFLLGKLPILTILCLTSVSSSATEAISYTYDAQGRLIKLETTGGSNNGEDVDTVYDDAHNRTDYTVSGAVTAPTIAIANQLVFEHQTFNFAVGRWGNTTPAVTVDYATEDGTANSGSDYTAVSGTVSFASGETIKYIPVSVVDDSINETLIETIYVKLTNPSITIVFANDSGLGQIFDNDP